MAPIILTLLQGLFLLLLYVFVARVVRWVVADVKATPAVRPQRRPAERAKTAAKAAKGAVGVTGKRIRPQELVVHPVEGRPSVVRLDGREVTFGRASDATVPLSDSYASERHARIYQDGEDWFVEDSGSTNGTYLNQAKLTSPRLISAGDQVAIGRTVIEVRK